MSDETGTLVARIEERLVSLTLRVASLESLVRWIALAVGGALLAAVLNLVIRAGRSVARGWYLRYTNRRIVFLNG